MIHALPLTASQNVNYFYKKYGNIVSDVDTASNIANTAIDGLQNFLSTFKDNPGRRLISIYMGAVLG